MRSNGSTTMSVVNSESANNYALYLSNCIKTKNLKLGRALHSHLIKTALTLDTFFTNRLMHMYSKCDSINCAEKAFDDHPFKNAHSWNTLISAYSQMGRFQKARNLLDEMPEPNLVAQNSMISSFCRGGFLKEAINMFKGVHRVKRSMVLMDEFTVVGLANACAGLAVLELLRQVHGVAVVMDLEFNVVVCNAMIDAYRKCGVPESGYAIFNQMEEKDVVSWTSMVAAYASAFRMKDACSIFEQMPFKNTVSWTSLITGFVRNGEGETALSYFTKMQDEGVVPNDFTYVSALSACADLAHIGKGKQIHCHIIRNGAGNVFDSVFVANALIDMYSKCGDMTSSMKLFDRFHRKDIVTWNSIITGFAKNGHGEASLAVFDQMIRANIRPNYVTFIGVLAACSHSGLESEGLRFLDMMQKDFGLIPRSDHYAILVDLLGRKNRLKEALQVIETAPHGSNRIGMWGALLATCCIHGNLELAVRAAEALFELEPENTGRYVMLSNIYATASKWDDAQQIRRHIDRMDLKKEAGSSWIEVKNTRHMFVAEDIFQSKTENIKELLLTLVDQMKDVGYLLPEDSTMPLSWNNAVNMKFVEN